MTERLEETERIIRSMEEILEDLIGLLQHENEAMRRQDRQIIRQLAPKKDRLSQIYDAQVRRLGREEELDAFIDDSRRLSLRQKAQSLQGLVEENARLLQVMMAVSEQVQGIFSAMAKSIQETFQTYNDKGSPQDRFFAKKLPLSLQRDI